MHYSDAYRLHRYFSLNFNLGHMFVESTMLRPEQDFNGQRQFADSFSILPISNILQGNRRDKYICYESNIDFIFKNILWLISGT